MRVDDAKGISVLNTYLTYVVLMTNSLRTIEQLMWTISILAVFERRKQHYKMTSFGVSRIQYKRNTRFIWLLKCSIHWKLVFFEKHFALTLCFISFRFFNIHKHGRFWKLNISVNTKYSSDRQSAVHKTTNFKDYVKYFDDPMSIYKDIRWRRIRNEMCEFV